MAQCGLPNSSRTVHTRFAPRKSAASRQTARSTNTLAGSIRKRSQPPSRRDPTATCGSSNPPPTKRAASASSDSSSDVGNALRFAVVVVEDGFGADERIGRVDEQLLRIGIEANVVVAGICDEDYRGRRVAAIDQLVRAELAGWKGDEISRSQLR